jgi:hypothetical protein
MNRYKAASIHLSLSVSALLLLTLVTLAYWYPPPHFEYEGTLEILLLIIMVDVVIGPLITLIVFAPDKPSLKFDMWTIAIVQIAAFVYGSYVIGSQYPAYLVYAKGQFAVAPAAEIDQGKIPDSSIREGFHPGPRLVMARLPDDPKVHAEFVVQQVADGKRLEWSPEFYQSYTPVRADVERDALDLEKLLKSDTNRAAIGAFLDRHELEEKDIYLLRLRSSLKLTAIVIGRQDLKPIGFIDIPV